MRFSLRFHAVLPLLTRRLRAWQSPARGCTCSSLVKPDPAGVHIVETPLSVTGWIRSIRRHKTRVFFDLTDGSSPLYLQVVAVNGPDCNHLKVGSAVTVNGKLNTDRQVSQPTRSSVIELKCSGELVADSIRPLDDLVSNRLGAQPALEGVHGAANPRPDLGLLRSESGLAWRHRLPEFGAMLRLRARIKSITRHVLGEFGYLEVDTPILTTADCEGSGETFRVKSTSEESKANLPAVFLTGSAQLHLEALTLGLNKVYTLGPTFRAERSHTRHHLAEFHMLEVESLHMNSVDALCDEIESIIRNLLRRIHDELYSSSHDKETQCDMALVLSRLTGEESWSDNQPGNTVDLNVLSDWASRMESILTSRQFVRISFADAKSAFPDSDPLQDFTKEEERQLVEIFGHHTPIFLTHFPSALKPFYCLSRDGNCAQAVDLLVPQIGELFGGSVRESDPDALQARITRSGIANSTLAWYTDMRRSGNAVHGGFGMGFERFLQFVFGVRNIKDVLPFPRVSNKIVL